MVTMMGTDEYDPNQAESIAVDHISKVRVIDGDTGDQSSQMVMQLKIAQTSLQVSPSFCRLRKIPRDMDTKKISGTHSTHRHSVHVGRRLTVCPALFLDLYQPLGWYNPDPLDFDCGSQWR